MRKTVSPKMRFQIMERDVFCCKYCGRKAPNVQLEIDHIVPVSNGGLNVIDNLVTACFECNRGKGSNDINGSTKDLYKTKIKNTIYEIKTEFYSEWNKNYLGSIDKSTATLLAMWITNYITFGGDLFNEAISSISYFSLDDDVQPTDKETIMKWEKANKEGWIAKFKTGGDFCDEVLNYMKSNVISEIIDVILFDMIMDDRRWGKDAVPSNILNYCLTESWNGEIYPLKKFTFYPSLIENDE